MAERNDGSKNRLTPPNPDRLPKRGKLNLTQALMREAETLGGVERDLENYNRVLAGIFLYRGVYRALTSCGVRPNAAHTAQVVDYFLSEIQTPYDETFRSRRYDTRDNADIAMGKNMTEAAMRTYQFANTNGFVDKRQNPPDILPYDRYWEIGHNFRVALHESLSIVSDAIHQNRAFIHADQSFHATARIMAQTKTAEQIELGTIDAEFLAQRSVVVVNNSGQVTLERVDKRKLVYAALLEELYRDLDEDNAVLTGTMLSRLSQGLITAFDFHQHMQNLQVSAVVRNRIYRSVGKRAGWRLAISVDEAKNILINPGDCTANLAEPLEESDEPSAPIANFPFKVKVAERYPQRPQADKPIVTEYVAPIAVETRRAPSEIEVITQAPEDWGKYGTVAILDSNHDRWEIEQKRAVVRVLALPLSIYSQRRGHDANVRGVLEQLGLSPRVLEDLAKRYGKSTPIGEIIERGLFPIHEDRDPILEDLALNVAIEVGNFATPDFNRNDIEDCYLDAVSTLWETVTPKPKKRAKGTEYAVRTAVNNTMKSFVRLWDEGSITHTTVPKTTSFWRLIQGEGEEWTGLRHIIRDVHFVLQGTPLRRSDLNFTLGEAFFARFIAEAKHQKGSQNHLSSDDISKRRSKVARELSELMKNYKIDSQERLLLSQVVSDLRS